MFASSVDASVLEAHEEALLRGYHSRLLHHIALQEAADDAVLGHGAGSGSSDRPQRYTYGCLQRHYELCLLDYCRFMAGWGWWGNVGWTQRRARELLARLPQLLQEQHQAEQAELQGQH